VIAFTDGHRLILTAPLRRALNLLIGERVEILDGTWCVGATVTSRAELALDAPIADHDYIEITTPEGCREFAHCHPLPRKSP
jgi:hypothetical protein